MRVDDVHSIGNVPILVDHAAECLRVDGHVDVPVIFQNADQVLAKVLVVRDELHGRQIRRHGRTCLRTATSKPNGSSSRVKHYQLE